MHACLKLFCQNFRILKFNFFFEDISSIVITAGESKSILPELGEINSIKI